MMWQQWCEQKYYQKLKKRKKEKSTVSVSKTVQIIDYTILCTTWLSSLIAVTKKKNKTKNYSLISCVHSAHSNREIGQFIITRGILHEYGSIFMLKTILAIHLASIYAKSDKVKTGPSFNKLAEWRKYPVLSELMHPGSWKGETTRQMTALNYTANSRH